MATISIADNDARKQYTQAVTANSTQLTIDFPFFSLDDINVIVTNTSGVDTTLTRGTGTGTFAVTGVSVDDGFSGGHVTLGDTYSDSGTKYTIFRDITVERTTDFPTSGPFNVSALNTELDKIFAIEQELETKIGRTMKLADSDTAASLTLPNLDTRKGTTLAFNATSGLPEAGPSIASVGTVGANVANINTVAGIAANVTDVAGVVSSVPTVAGVASSLPTVAGVASNITTVAGIHGNVTTVAGIQANVTTVAGIHANVTTVAGINTTHLSNVSGVASNVGLLGTTDAVADMNTLAAISTDITSLADSLEKTYTVTVVNPGSGNFFYLDGAAYPAIEMFRGNTYIFNQTDSSNDGHPLVFKNNSSAYEVGVTYFLNGSATTQSNYVNVTTFNAGRSSGDRKVQIEVATTAPSTGLRYYCYVHGNGMGNTITVKDSNISLVAGGIANINTVAGIQANVTTVAGIQANVTTVAGIDTEIAAVVNNQTNVNNVGGSISNVNLVGGSIANVNNVASNISSVNNFGERYRVSANEPNTSKDVGDLWFDTTNNLMKVYGTGGAFQNAGSSVNGTSERKDYVVGTSQGSYNGSTTIFPATYDGGFVDVYLNGIKLQPADFTASNGTTVELQSAAQTNDTVSIVGYGTFVIQTLSTNNLSDVSSTGVTNGQVLAYNSTSGDFEPTTITVPASDLVNDTSPQLGGTLDTNNQAIQFGSSKWTIELSGNNLLFKYNGTAKIKFADDGEIVTVDDVTAFGSI